MSSDTTMTPALSAGLDRLAVELQAKYRGVFGVETVRDLVLDSYHELAERATVTTFILANTERFASERLDALVHTEQAAHRIPGVLFMCVHNAGRSQMALGWFTHLAGGRAVAWSGGSEPESEVNAAAVAAMAEVGVDISREFPKPWTNEVFGAADVVVTMGCGDACPLVAGKRYEDWELDDPRAKGLDEVRVIRDEIRARVVTLLDELGVAAR